MYIHYTHVHALIEVPESSKVDAGIRNEASSSGNQLLEALDIYNKDIYPNIYYLLKVLCTLPVSTSSPERMFSTMNRVETYLRNTMSEV